MTKKVTRAVRKTSACARVRDDSWKRPAASTRPAGFSFLYSRELNSFSPHLALSVSPWPCQRLSWSSCSSRSTRLGLYAEFISKVNTWTRDKHRMAAFKKLCLSLGVDSFIFLCERRCLQALISTPSCFHLLQTPSPSQPLSPRSEYSMLEWRKNSKFSPQLIISVFVVDLVCSICITAFKWWGKTPMMLLIVVVETERRPPRSPPLPPSPLWVRGHSSPGRWTEGAQQCVPCWGTARRSSGDWSRFWGCSIFRSPALCVERWVKRKHQLMQSGGQIKQTDGSRWRGQHWPVSDWLAACCLTASGDDDLGGARLQSWKQNNVIVWQNKVSLYCSNYYILLLL